jgi:hypothetical protein
MPPIGPQDGTDLAVDGKIIFGRSIRAQADLMAANGRFTVVEAVSQNTRQVCGNGVGYLFARFTTNRHNCCFPLGTVDNQNTQAYGGAMTLLEGPNLVGLRVMTDLLAQRGYTSPQLLDFVWPLQPSFESRRERALITFQQVASIMQNNTKIGMFFMRDLGYVFYGILI